MKCVHKIRLHMGVFCSLVNVMHGCEDGRNVLSCLEDNCPNSVMPIVVSRMRLRNKLGPSLVAVITVPYKEELVGELMQFGVKTKEALELFVSPLPVLVLGETICISDISLFAIEVGCRHVEHCGSRAVAVNKIRFHLLYVLSKSGANDL